MLTCFSDRARHFRTISPSNARLSSTDKLWSVYLASLVCPCLLTSRTNLMVMLLKVRLSRRD